jgi:glycosyltransferase involved in cell wall biosynthesis
MMRPLRFALVTTFYPPYNFGGDGIYVQRLARSLVAQGHHVEVIHDTDGYRALSGRDPAVPESDDGVIVHRLRSASPRAATIRVHQTGRPAGHARTLQRLLGNRFDVIHYHNISLIGGPGVWGIGKGVKLHTAHEHWLVCPTHILWRDNREICEERACLRCQLAYRRPPQMWRATDLLARESHHVDRFLMLSASSERNHAAFGFQRPMTVIPSFLPDAPPLPTNPAHDAAARPYFLFVGRLEAIKGLQDAIPLFRNLDADLLIAGAGDYEPELRKLARGLDNVRFLGRVEPENLRSLYRDARAVLAPSRCYEVFPLIVLEAFREGTPILARDLGPYPDIVADSGAGLLFKSQAEHLAALQRLTAERDFAASLGRNGRRAFELNWSAAKAEQTYFNIISEAADQKGLSDLAVQARAWRDAGCAESLRG